MGIIPEKKCLRDPTQLLKFTILFICGIFTCTQVAECFRKFIHPPASTHSEFVLNDSIRYPCVTICRRPAYKTYLFPKFGLTRFLESHTAFRAFNFSQFTLSDLWEETTFNFTEIVGQYAYASTGSNYGVVNKTILGITPSYHFRRGRCYTFQPIKRSDIFSITGGFIFFLHHNNTFQQLNDYGISTHGFQIYLHDPNEDVTYDEDEKSNFLEILDIEASEDMRVKFEIQEFGRIPTKENDCTPHANYSKSRCEEKCVNDQISRANNCSAPFLILPEDNKTPECNSHTSITNLIRDYISPTNRKRLVKNCNCPMACNFTIYKTSIINRRPIEPLLAPNSMFCLYSTNLLFRMSEVLGYDWNQLLSDIGGSLGFLLDSLNEMWNIAKGVRESVPQRASAMDRERANVLSLFAAYTMIRLSNQFLFQYVIMGLSVISLICLCEEIFKLVFRWVFNYKTRKAQKKLEQSNNTNSDKTDNNKKETTDISDVIVKEEKNKSNQLKSENTMDVEPVHEYNNLNKFVSDFNFYKKDSEFNDLNSNINAKY